ncbi:MAG: Uma2 family endonuclease [Chloroflexaceae bacterium]|jgi:Uma2 family endonuclease|nr:Uma2 family endonuclease [Chloroflexaceae bacterium]
MTVELHDIVRGQIVYPTSDGLPMADNTKQFRWIITIQGGCDGLFKDDPNVFVAGDLLWYPVEGKPTIRRAPDTMVVFGRPKGDRGAYLQWEEGNIPPQVVFEVLSPGNTAKEMATKFQFYSDYGVEEYYIYDPDNNELEGWQRDGLLLKPIARMQGWVSPRLGIRFVVTSDTLQIYRPDGSPFLSYIELERERDEERVRAEHERRRAEQEWLQAQQERQRAEQERQRAEQERMRAEALAAHLRSLGIDPDSLPS